MILALFYNRSYYFLKAQVMCRYSWLAAFSGNSTVNSMKVLGNFGFEERFVLISGRGGGKKQKEDEDCKFVYMAIICYLIICVTNIDFLFFPSSRSFKWCKRKCVFVKGAIKKTKKENDNLHEDLEESAISCVGLVQLSCSQSINQSVSRSVNQ